MYGKRVFFIVELTILVGTLLITAAPTAQVASTQLTGGVEPMGEGNPGYNLTIKFHDFFELGPGWSPETPFEQSLAFDIWNSTDHGRWAGAKPEEYVVSYPYPFIYTWLYEADPDQYWWYTVMQLTVHGTELWQINIDNVGGYLHGPVGLLPYNLLGGSTVPVGQGTVDVSWYMQYPSYARAEYLESIYPNTVKPNVNYDGWLFEWNGTIKMDAAATKKILGITDADYANIVDWWENEGGKDDVETAWASWLNYEGITAHDIYCFYGSAFAQVLPITLELSYDGTYTTLTVESVTWGLDYLMPRWFREADILEGYEYPLSDFWFNATIGPTTTDLDIEATAMYASYMWSEGDIATTSAITPQTSAFGWEGVWGDEIVSPHPYHPSDMEPYAALEYFCVGPGHNHYGQDLPFDYTPAAWDLLENETIIFDFSNVKEHYDAGTPLWIWTQMPWGVTEEPLDTIRNDTGYLILGTVDPWPETLPYGVFSYVPNASVTFTGPFNFTEWSETYLAEDWAEIGGMLPVGCPALEFRVIRGPGDLNGDGIVNWKDLWKFRDHAGAAGRDDPLYNPQVDIGGGMPPTHISYGDGFANWKDLWILRGNLGNSYP